MNGVLVVDTNLMLLLVVGTASRAYIAQNKGLKRYSVDDFDAVVRFVGMFSELILLPHILAEVSNLAPQGLAFSATKEVRGSLQTLMESCFEYPFKSLNAVKNSYYNELGLTDAVILQFCQMSANGIPATLLTADTPLANRAASLGLDVFDYNEDWLPI